MHTSKKALHSMCFVPLVEISSLWILSLSPTFQWAAAFCCSSLQHCTQEHLQMNANQGTLLTRVKSFGSVMTQPGFYFPQIKAPVCANAEFTTTIQLAEVFQSSLKIGHVANQASLPPPCLLYQQDKVMITSVNTACNAELWFWTVEQFPIFLPYFIQKHAVKMN